MGFWSKEARQAYYQRNKSLIKKRTSVYYKAHLELYKKHSKKNSLKRLYGLTFDQYKELLDRARYRCEICGRQENLCVDHNHSTKKVRGIICAKCNLALGQMEDSIELLKSAVKYLEKK